MFYPPSVCGLWHFWKFLSLIHFQRLEPPRMLGIRKLERLMTACESAVVGLSHFRQPDARSRRRQTRG